MLLHPIMVVLYTGGEDELRGFGEAGLREPS
jgi:hypothetical protein